jgi:spermidine synthase
MHVATIFLMAASGFAGLGYQIAWTQQSAVWLGHESAAMLAIVAAFFGGLSLGAWWSGRRIDASPRPAFWYAGCEAVIGLWGAVLIFLMAPAARTLLSLIGPEPGALWQWTVAFAGTFLLLLPSTAAMGATIPAMERLVSAMGAHPRPIALLYGANTFGALCGVSMCAFVLVPRFGFTVTLTVCVSLNLLCAAAAWALKAARAAPARVEGVPRGSGPLLTLFFTGLLGIGYELLVVRALSQLAENTIFTFAILLAVYLAGTALGAASYARGWIATRRSDLRSRLLHWQAIACLAGVLALAGAGPLQAWTSSWLGSGMGAALGIELLLAILAFLLPTIVMGALFSHLLMSVRAQGTNPGSAIAVNTLGAALAPLLFGVCLLPAVGVTNALLALAAGYLLLSTPRSWLAAAPMVAATGAVALALWHPSLAALRMPEGGRLIRHAEGIAATVSVIEGPDGVTTLHINNRQQEGSDVTLYSDGRQALLPVLLHPHPGRALFLGLGTGATARTATLDPGLQVDAVELLPEVIEASALFARLQETAPQPRLHVFAADARRFVRSTDTHYDVIVSDNFHPARSGSASLYTVEHFAAIRDRLRAGGVFCQWLPLHQLDHDTLRTIVRSFTEVYSRGWAVLATHSLDTPVIGLIARRDGETFELAQLRTRLTSPAVAGIAKDFGLDGDFGLPGQFLAGPGALRRLGSGAPLNTDDHPVVAWQAPRITYEPDSTPRARLLTLLSTLRVTPAEILVDSRDAAWNHRLTAYWQARHRYLEVGSLVRPTDDVRAMIEQVHAPLLSVLRISGDFRPAYDPLVNLARELGRTDAPAARELLTQLSLIHPDWIEASQALAELSGESHSRYSR